VVGDVLPGQAMGKGVRGLARPVEALPLHLLQRVEVGGERLFDMVPNDLLCGVAAFLPLRPQVTRHGRRRYGEPLFLQAAGDFLRGDEAVGQDFLDPVGASKLCDLVVPAHISRPGRFFERPRPGLSRGNASNRILLVANVTRVFFE
jgi:hypothetical protein